MPENNQFSWQFKCAGNFAGVTSFKDESGEEQNFMKIEFFGGRVSVQISPKVADRISGNVPGIGVRVSGELLFNAGNPKPVVKSIAFEGDKNFKPLEMSELLSGMTFEGLAKLGQRATGERDDDTRWANVFIITMGGAMKVNVDPEAFEKLPPRDSLVYLNGQVFTNIRDSFIDGKSTQVVKNSILVRSAKTF